MYHLRYHHVVKSPPNMHLDHILSLQGTGKAPRRPTVFWSDSGHILRNSRQTYMKYPKMSQNETN